MSHRLPFTRIAHNPLKPELVLANGTEFLVVNTSTGELVRPYPTDADRTQKYVDQHRSIAFNADGTLLVTTGDDKKIRVFNTNDWSLKLTRNAIKRVNAIRFSKDNQIVVADKFGDVYCHPLDESNDSKLSPIVGHVSMVTDMTLSTDEKFVITADRDEHIRVSQFPNGYNIETFCLGHTDVVTCVQILPWDIAKLVSAGGDSTIRLWDYVKGKEVQMLDIRSYIEKYIPAAADANSADPMVNSITLDPKSESVAIGFAKTPAVLIFEWNKGSLVYKETLETKNPVLSISWDLESRLWVSVAAESEDLVLVFRKTDEKFEQVPSDDSLVKQINGAEAGLVEILPDLYSIFGLRKFLDLPEQAEEGENGQGKNKKRKVAA
ncbi:WD repeat-containing protein 4 [Apophysomyces ossiformis]|uniref:WD repeat-containing protein 4 n=1 Tax=Apophysomyces ossiformis TaxID=679940 RepID=A0A8H7BG74_9FUNG|nr:WD repeat-containing protein 4 [Apophysomyces ossiformis]